MHLFVERLGFCRSVYPVWGLLSAPSYRVPWCTASFARLVPPLANIHTLINGTLRQLMSLLVWKRVSCYLGLFTLPPPTRYVPLVECNLVFFYHHKERCKRISRRISLCKLLKGDAFLCCVGPQNAADFNPLALEMDI